MVRRISSSQMRSKLRQAQSKHRQAVNQLNREIRTYNSKVRAHNARVRANQDRLRRELQKLSRTATKPQLVAFRASVDATQRSFTVLERRADADHYGEQFDRFLDMSEREAANSVSVMNVLQGEMPEEGTDEPLPKSQIGHILNAISQDVHDRWRGALFALSPQNPDAARHFCTSARELMTEILEKFAPDDEVKQALPDCEVTQQGKPTRRAKIHFFFHHHGIVDAAATDFVEDNMENVVQLFRVFNDGTHGSSGRFEHSQLLAIRARVEGAVSFLWGIITGSTFSDANSS